MMIDETIIHRAQKGDTSAFQQIVDEYHGLLWRTTRILFRNPMLIDDILQEIWIDVWKGLPNMQNPLTLRSWLLTVVSNRCPMMGRRNTLVTVSLESEPDVFQLPDNCEDGLKQVMRLEVSTDIHRALSQLSDEQRRVLELRYFGDLELSEIALITDQRLGTVKSRQHRALQILRTILQVEKGSSFYEYTV